MQIVRGRFFGAQRRVIYGPWGVGKSTFACCPGSLALDCEDALGHIGCDRVTWASTWEGNLKLAREMCESKGDWTTVVIDTADALEQQAAKEICIKAKKDSLSDFGYGDGYFAVATKWRELLFALQGAKKMGRSVHLVAHVTTATIKDPTLPKDHQKHIAALTKHSWAATAGPWADSILFADYERGMSEGRAVMTGTRLLHTVAGTGFDAKHRPNIKPVLPLSWKDYEREFKRYERTAEQVIASIMGKAEALPKGTLDEAAFKIALTDAAQDVEKLVRVELRVESKSEPKQGNENGAAPQPAPGPLGPSPSFQQQEK